MINRKLVGKIMNFSNMKKGGGAKRGGEGCIKFVDQRVRPRKTGKSSIFYAGVSNMKGGGERGATFPNVCSDQI